MPPQQAAPASQGLEVVCSSQVVVTLCHHMQSLGETRHGYLARREVVSRQHWGPGLVSEMKRATQGSECQNCPVRLWEDAKVPGF